MRAAASLALLLMACGGTQPMKTKTRSFDLQGHRGARGLEPENTLPAFERALEIGVTTLELDIGVTADDIVVVSHDTEINPEITRKDGEYIGEPIAIRSLTRDQLRAFDVGRIRPGTEYAGRFPAQRARDQIEIPTLDEVFEVAEKRSGKTIRYNIETKLAPGYEKTVAPAQMARALVRVIRRHELQGRAVIQSFDWASLEEARRIAPEIATVCLTEEGEREAELPARAKAIGCSVWSPNHRSLDRETVEHAHELRLEVVPWTVNEPQDMRRVIDLGVDGLISDYPDRARRVLQERGLHLPTSFPK